MNTFYYEDGQEIIFNKEGEGFYDPMKDILTNVDVSNIVLETITTRQTYLSVKYSEKVAQETSIKKQSKPNGLGNADENSALKLKLGPRTVQKWYKTWKEGLDSLLKTVGRPKIIEPEGELAEATKSLVSGFYHIYPTAAIDQLTDQMASSFKFSGII
ncbi:MAG: hypothetical protein EXX96DRAFT_647346 [Benjaminiella poitrasii]|nr:MAG: hypothetical protein EXX96DRAFT_647346 [Benjaminiella poitrasii]